MCVCLGCVSVCMLSDAVFVLSMFLHVCVCVCVYVCVFMELLCMNINGE